MTHKWRGHAEERVNLVVGMREISPIRDGIDIENRD
jgi:hypothetical protein